MSCGVEQSTVLPSVAFLGAVAWGLGSYRISQSTLGAKRERDWRKRRAGETLGVETSWIEPKAIGHTTDRSSDVSEKVKAAAESSHLAMRAIHEDRVLLLDRDGYLAARSYLRISGGCLICASVAATAQPSAGDLLFATLRQLLLLLLCIDFAFTVPGQVAFLLRSARGQSLQKLPLLTSRHHEDLMPFPSGPASLLRSLRSSKPLPFERLRLGLLQLAALLMLIWFEVFRHPKLRESACEGEVALLLSERSSAFTMTFAWLCAAMARLSAWQCEACVWLAPRAEELLAEYLETDGGVVLQGSACALAEGLCGEDGPSWLNELQQLSVIVMDGSCQLSVPAKGLPTLSEIMNLQHEAQLELRRLSQLLEAPKEPREATGPSTERPERSERARPLARRRSHEVAALAAATKREELLKTKFEFPRGDGKPSDSGDSSSPRNAADPQRVMVDLGVGVADGPRGHGHGGLAQLLEEALAPAMSKSKVPLPEQTKLRSETRAAAPETRGLQRSASQGERMREGSASGAGSSTRRPKRYSEMRKLSLEQRSVSRSSLDHENERQQAHWTVSDGQQQLQPVAPAPPSPPWNVQSMASPLTQLQEGS